MKQPRDLTEDRVPRPLPSQPYISLAEALTWRAFGDALTPDELRSQVEGRRQPSSVSPEERFRILAVAAEVRATEPAGIGHFCDRDDGLRKLEAAWRELRDEVDCGKVRMRGRYSGRCSLSDAQLAETNELTGAILATFSQFDVATSGIQRRPSASPFVIWNDDPLAFDRGFAAAAGDDRASDGYLLIEVETEAVLGERANRASLRSHPARRGRPRGAGGWAAQDEPILEKMRERIAANPGMTAHDAAGYFAVEAAGNAGLVTKQKRLWDRYRKMHGN